MTHQGMSGLEDGVINFAVLQNGATNWASDISGLTFTGFNAGGALDTGATYLYLYEPTNTNHSGSGSDQFFNTVSVAFDPTFANSITSWGYFTDTATGKAVAFSDTLLDGGAIVNAANNLGLNDTDPPPEGLETGILPSGFQVNLPGIVGATTNVTKNVDPMGGTIKMSYSQMVNTTKSGTIFGFTCTCPPGWQAGSIQDGSVAEYFVPSPIPEPSTMFLLGLGFLGLAGGALKRKRSA